MIERSTKNEKMLYPTSGGNMQRKVITGMSLVILVFMFSCSTTQDKNAIPYPKKEWKGVQGKNPGRIKTRFYRATPGSGRGSQCAGYHAG
jgi:hypothetical protein